MMHSRHPGKAINTESVIWPTVLGWLFIILGWLANHYLSEIRDRRKEIRSQIDNLIQSLDKFREEAINFHSSENFDSQSASNLKLSLRKIEGAALRVSIIDEQLVGLLVKRVRQAATLKNFEPSDFQTQIYSSDIINSIQLTVEDYIATLESGYSRKYPNKFPYYNFK